MPASQETVLLKPLAAAAGLAARGKADAALPAGKQKAAVTGNALAESVNQINVSRTCQGKRAQQV